MLLAHAQFARVRSPETPIHDPRRFSVDSPTFLFELQLPRVWIELANGFRFEILPVNSGYGKVRVCVDDQLGGHHGVPVCVSVARKVRFMPQDHHDHRQRILPLHICIFCCSLSFTILGFPKILLSFVNSTDSFFPPHDLPIPV